MDDAMKACLFGGTLMFAGLGHGQTWNLVDDPNNYETYAFASDYQSYQIGYSQGFTGTFEHVYTTAGARAILSDSLASAYAFSTKGGFPPSYAQADVEFDFTVDSDLSVILSWDIPGGSDGTSLTQLRLIDETNQQTLFTLFNPGSNGTAERSVFAGVEYRIEISTFNFGDVGSALLTAELVPTPGVAGLLAAAGLAGTVRRRRD